MFCSRMSLRLAALQTGGKIFRNSLYVFGLSCIDIGQAVMEVVGIEGEDPITDCSIEDVDFVLR